jgi:hypothetical protein
MSQGLKSFLLISLGVFFFTSLLGVVSMGVAAWYLDRSLTAMMANMTADTGWVFGLEEVPDRPSHVADDEEMEDFGEAEEEM